MPGMVEKGKDKGMTELLHNAWSGWTSYNIHGKLPALLLAVLLYLWYCGKKREEVLLAYTSLMAVCCIFPVTAAFLMLYQTKFYNYEWIWSLVPLTAVTAYGITVFMAHDQTGGREKSWRNRIPAILFAAVILFFSGSLGRQVWDRREEKGQREQAYEVLEELTEKYSPGDLCLWAPREIMEFAREAEPALRLSYGRNIWDAYLNAYAYDTYEEDVMAMERWMSYNSGTGEADLEAQSLENGKMGERLTLENCAEKALAAGVNCVLLSGKNGAGAVARMEKALGVKAQPIQNYILFFVGEEESYGRTD